MSRWFRFYEEALDDPKVQKLAPADFKGWVNLLCLASRNDGKLPPVGDIAFALRMDENAVETLVERLLNGGLIDRRNGGANGSFYAPHGWDKRQFKSDTSTDRVKRFRKRSKADTVTPPETETETDRTLAKAKDDSDRHFWVTAKAYLADHGVKNPGGMVGKWSRDFGKPQTAKAITAAQTERAVDPIPYVERVLRGASHEIDAWSAMP